MKYLVFTDMHLHQFTEFASPDKDYYNSRVRDQISALNDMLDIAQRDKLTVLFLGDLFHHRNSVRTEIYNQGFKAFANHPDVPVYMIEGNHDNINNSINSDSSLIPFSYLPNVTVIPRYETVQIGDDLIDMVSYGEEYAELKEFMQSSKANILLAHLAVQGAYGAGNSKLDGNFTTGDFDKYDLTLLGHYHRRQRLSEGVYYVGNPVAQNFADEGLEKGYMTFNTDNGQVLPESITFHKLDYPMFLSYNASELPEDIDNIMKHNFVKVEVSAEEKDTIKQLETERTNVRIEKTVAVQPTQSRLGVSEHDSVVDISKAWAEKFQPDNVDTIVKELQKAIQ